MTDPLLALREKKLALKEEHYRWQHEQAAKEYETQTRLRERAVDFEYLKLTVVLVLVIIVIWYLTCKFGFGRGMGAPGTPETSSPSKGSEHFSPYASILTPDIGRSDASFDYANNMPYKDPEWSQRMNVEFNSNAQRMASEDKLFDQLNDLIL